MPAPESGLSLTEERALDTLASGPQSAGTLFKTVAKRETARFLGDAPFFRRLDGLCFAPRPLIAGLPYTARECNPVQGRSYREIAQAEITITDEGRAALAGRIDHARANGIDRWIGGTHVNASSLWRWDQKAERLIDP